MTDQPSKAKQSVKRKTKRCCFEAKCKNKLTLTDMPCRCNTDILLQNIDCPSNIIVVIILRQKMQKNL